MKLLLRVARPSPACRAKLPVRDTIVTSPWTAVCPALLQFRRSVILPENAATKLHGKSPGFVAARPALAHPALRSKSPAVRMQSDHLLLAKDAPVLNR